MLFVSPNNIIIVMDPTPKLCWISWNSHHRIDDLMVEWQRFMLHVSAFSDGPLHNLQPAIKLGFLKCFIGDEGRKHFDKWFQHGSESPSNDLQSILKRFEPFLFQTLSSGDEAATASGNDFAEVDMSSPPANQLSNSLHNAGTVSSGDETAAASGSDFAVVDKSSTPANRLSNSLHNAGTVSSGDETATASGSDFAVVDKSSTPANRLSNSLHNAGTGFGTDVVASMAQRGEDSSYPTGQVAEEQSDPLNDDVKALQEICTENAEGLDRSDDSGVDSVPMTDGNSENVYRFGTDVVVSMAQRGEDSSYPTGRVTEEQSDPLNDDGLGEHDGDIALNGDTSETVTKIRNLYTAEQERSMDKSEDSGLGPVGQSASLMDGPPTSRRESPILPGGHIDELTAKKATGSPQTHIKAIEEYRLRCLEGLQETMKCQPKVAAGTGSGGDSGNVFDDVPYWKTPKLIDRSTFVKNWDPRMAQILDRHFQHSDSTTDFLAQKNFNLGEVQICKDEKMSNLLMRHRAFQNYTYGELIDDLLQLDLRCLKQEIEYEVARLNVREAVEIQ